MVKRLSNELGVDENEILSRFDKISFKKRVKDDSNIKETSIRLYDSKSDKAQLEILSLLIHNSSLANDITLSLLDNKMCYNIVKTIKDNHQKYNNVAQLLELIGDNPEERNLVAALSTEAKTDKDTELIVLNDCIKTLEDISIKREINKIRNQIRIAEDNDNSLDTNLIRRLEELQKKVI